MEKLHGDSSKIPTNEYEMSFGGKLNSNFLYQSSEFNQDRLTLN